MLTISTKRLLPCDLSKSLQIRGFRLVGIELAAK